MYGARVRIFLMAFVIILTYSAPVYDVVIYGQDWIARWDEWAETGGY